MTINEKESINILRSKKKTKINGSTLDKIQNYQELISIT
jgi:hypothetical protein